jgi:hypothetical protein
LAIAASFNLRWLCEVVCLAGRFGFGMHLACDVRAVRAQPKTSEAVPLLLNPGPVLARVSPRLVQKWRQLKTIPGDMMGDTQGRILSLG